MTGSFNACGHFTLIFQRSTGNPAGKNLTLFIQEFLQKFRIFIIHIFDLVLFEPAIFFLFYFYSRRCKYRISD